MLKFKSIEMRNFLSFGNVPQVVNLEDSPLSVIVGINNDASTDDETRNGVGKSSLIQAMHFAIYGKSIDNKIKLTNLVNKTNKKHCSVKLQFEQNGIMYQIERTRSPNNLVFMVNGRTLDNNEAQGENKETQLEIESIIGMSQDVFSQIVTLTTNTEPFLSLSAAKQRVIIDELFTITQLSEKAEKLKESIKTTKDLINKELFKIQTIDQTNAKMHLAIESALSASSKFESTRLLEIESLEKERSAFSTFNLEDELNQYKEYTRINSKNTEISKLEISAVQLYDRYNSWNIEFQNSLNEFNVELKRLQSIDIEQEILNHDANLEIQKVIEDNNIIDKEILHLNTQKMQIKKLLDEYSKKVSNLEIEIDNIAEHSEQCPLCNGVINSDVHEKIINDKKDELKKYQTQVTNTSVMLEECTTSISSSLSKKVEVKPLVSTVYKNKNDATEHSYKIKTLEEKITDKTTQINPYDSQLNDITKQIELMGEKEIVPNNIWKSESELHLTYQYIQSLKEKISTEKNRINPYIDQIEQLKNALIAVDEVELNRLRTLLDHQDFLVKLLTDKNSFVRKTIINQNLSFLNERLRFYIEKSSSLHTVKFENDLSVNITKFGESYDYDNLSRGEKTRIIISLSLAFRDLYESLNSPINSLMIDEFLDNGLDAVGVKSCYDIINLISQYNKNCFLITHREEIKNKCPVTLTITMEGGFSTIQQESEA